MTSGGLKHRYEGGDCQSTSTRNHRIISRLRGVAVIIRQNLAKARVRARGAVIDAEIARQEQEEQDVDSSQTHVVPAQEDDPGAECGARTPGGVQRRLAKCLQRNEETGPGAIA